MINSFSGENHFLSNFSASEVWLDGKSYPSVEHAYQAAKTIADAQREMIRNAPTPKEAKRLGRIFKLQPHWEEMKVEVMETLVRQKFRSHPELAQKLVSTGHQPLIEGNWWGDTFWGVCRGKGQNQLGKILMSVRAELREDIRD